MPIDPRTNSDVHHGTRARDGAVDPKPGDFLGPTNAGAAGAAGNPHGPNVVSPGLHATQDLHPVRPGEVSSDPATQQAAEIDHLAIFKPAAPAAPPASPEGA